MHKVIVNTQGEKSLKRRHPWIFSGAVHAMDSLPGSGETVAVHATDGRWLAWGAYSPQSQIRIRVWSFEADEPVAASFFQRRLQAAMGLRQKLPQCAQVTARRWVNAESDHLPGLIVDQYGDFLVCQFLTAGTEYWREVIADQLQELIPARGLYERSDADVRLKEGLTSRCGLLWGQAPPDLVEIRLQDVSMWVDLIQGHKTGAYLDQIHNQAMIRAYCSKAEVLNCFCYTGGFGIQALKGGAAHVTQIDASSRVLDISSRNVALNGLDERRVDHLCGNVFEILRKLRDTRRQFDLIVLDPPKFVASKGQLEKGTRGYKDINLLAFKLLRPDGVLFTFSCSGLVPPMLFQKIVSDAALDADRRATIVGRLDQAADHPVGLNFPEGRYLKGLICFAG